MNVPCVDPAHVKLATMVGLANEYCIEPHYENALRLQIEIAKRSQNLRGMEDPVTLSAMDNLASTYTYMGRYLDAIALQKKVVELSSKVLGANSRETLMSQNNLANSYKSSDDIETAIGLHQEVLGRRKSLLGDEHVDTVTSMNNLASCYFHIRRLKDAVSLQEQVVLIRQKNNGYEHFSTLISMENLATMYAKANDPMHCLVSGTKPGTDAFPEQDMFYRLEFLNRLAQTFDKLGQPKRAHRWYETLVYTAECQYGFEHPNTLATVNNLAVNCGYQGLNEEAAKNLERILEVCERGGDSQRLTRLRCMSNFAFCLIRMGSINNGFEIHHKAIEESVEHLSLEHPVTINAINKLRDSYHDNGQSEEALRLDKFLAISKPKE